MITCVFLCCVFSYVPEDAFFKCSGQIEFSLPNKIGTGLKNRYC